MIPGIDPKIDYAFKRIFGREQNRALLVDLINAVLEPVDADRVVDVEILNPFNEKDTEGDKLSIVDVKARDGSGRYFNVEMQMLPDRYLRQRLLYYWGRDLRSATARRRALQQAAADDRDCLHERVAFRGADGVPSLLRAS